jgi:hypothetical protein
MLFPSVTPICLRICRDLLHTATTTTTTTTTTTNTNTTTTNNNNNQKQQQWRRQLGLVSNKTDVQSPRRLPFSLQELEEYIHILMSRNRDTFRTSTKILHEI